MDAQPARAAALRIESGKLGKLGKLLGVLIALKLALLFTFAWHARFVMDEFVFLGNAKYLFDEFFHSYWPAKAVGYALFFKPAHAIGWDASSILLAGRLQTALLACATIAIIYGCARALGENRVRSLAIVLIMLSFSNVMERMFRTIAEPVALFFGAAALFVVLRGHADRARTLLLAGALSGLAFLATQKAVYFNVGLGLALLADAALSRRYVYGLKRGAWLVLGWLIPIIAYCFAFGRTNPLPIAQSLFFGPIEVATTGADAYTEIGGLRGYVWQTLLRNSVLYGFCIAGLGSALARIRQIEWRSRIAAVFTLVVTVLVFTHDQPWPYVFIMALPFMALWALIPIDRPGNNVLIHRLAIGVFAIAIAVSFVANLFYFRFGNGAQLELVEHAEALVGPEDIYFDGIGMLPNRSEPSTLWLDKAYVLKTLREGPDSEAYRIFAQRPPKVIIWSYRMDRIAPVVGPLVHNSYIQVAPNLRMAGRRFVGGQTARFDVPVTASYALYSAAGEPLAGEIRVDGVLHKTPVSLAAGTTHLVSARIAGEALLVPQGSYRGHFRPGSDNDNLFANIYN